jgi:phage terminase large subunit-like protein
MTNPSFKNTVKQDDAVRLMIAEEIFRLLLLGGSRSGKTAINIKAIIIRAQKETSRHAIIRSAFNHAKQSIWHDSFPKVMKLAFPALKVKENKQDWFWEFTNGSTIWLGGLDDKDRADKILGNEYSTIYFNECSQMAYRPVEVALTRLAENNSLKKIALFDENPPSKGHWSHKLFIEKKNPIDNSPVAFPDMYAYLRMNPDDNRHNLPANYIEQTLAGLSGRSRLRFLLGEFQDDNENALFKDISISENRVTQQETPVFEKACIAIDPATTSKETSDETGLIVVGKCGDHFYVCKDLSGKYTPSGWGQIVCDEYTGNLLNFAVAETNQGGDMVEAVLRGIDRNITYRGVHAHKGKALRAEPVAALYERGLVHHVGLFEKLESEMTGWDISQESPNRLDALVYAILELSGSPVYKPAKFNFL